MVWAQKKWACCARVVRFVVVQALVKQNTLSDFRKSICLLGAKTGRFMREEWKWQFPCPPGGLCFTHKMLLGSSRNHALRTRGVLFRVAASSLFLTHKILLVRHKHTFRARGVQLAIGPDPGGLCFYAQNASCGSKTTVLCERGALGGVPGGRSPFF